jgi:type II restriction enzyme
MAEVFYKKFIKKASSLITPYEQTRAGFVALALEKNRLGTPYVEEAKVLKIEASKATKPIELLKLKRIKHALLTAAGVSDKAAGHLTDTDKTEAVKGLIENFLEPAGKDFIDELVYRFLLTKGDTLGGSMRNLAGKLGEKKFLRALISLLAIRGKIFSWRDSKTNKWFKGDNGSIDIETSANAISWQTSGRDRVLIFNIVVPIVKKNVDVSLLNCTENDINSGSKSAYYHPEKYIALGELKGGIDPAGADEHWKTANSALERIRKSFSGKKLKPYIFFVGAAIEKAMADEIFNQLQIGTLTCAGNLTIDKHLVEICGWLIDL